MRSAGLSSSRGSLTTLGALLLVGLTYSVSQTALIPAVPHIAEQIDTSAVGATALMSAFFVAAAIAVGPVGRLGDMFGKRRLLMVEMAMFSIGSLVCVLATALVPLLVGRAIMGSAVGLFPLTFAILRDELPPDKVPTGIALSSSMVGIGAASGMGLGGLISDALGFHWIFVISLVMGLAALVAVAALIPESPVRSPGRVDVAGIALLAVGVAAPLLTLGQAPTWGWLDPRTLAGCAVGAVFLGMFLAHERGHPAPLLHLPTLAQPRVALTNVATLLMGFGMFGAAVIVVQFLQVPESTGWGFGLSATQAGLCIVPGAMLMLFFAPIAGRVTSRYGGRVTLLVGTSMSAVALGAMALAHDHQALMVLWPTLLMVGNSFGFAATPALTLSAVPQTRSGESTGVNMIARFVGSSWGTLVAAACVTASVGAGGVATEGGYTLAFAVQAAAAVGALLIALGIPRPPASVAPEVRSGRGAMAAPLASEPRV